METRTRVVIADDHPIFREGLAKGIGEDTAFAVVGQAGDGAAALKLVQELRPDIAVLDISMPIMSGIDVARKIHQEALPTELVLLTMYKDQLYFNAALDLGVRGYLLKESVVGELMACLRAVNDGEYYISPAVSHFLIERNRKAEALAASTPSIERLTPAERAILKLLAENLTSKEMAERLSVSIRTVENHRTHLSQKLCIKGHHKLLQFALENKGTL
jgi:DNA-binding NarL/FixJ family response regulator